MTVIACDGTTLAGDSQITEDDLISHRRKVFRKKDCIIGFAGCYASGMTFVEWFGSKKPRPDFPGGFDALILYDDGRFYRTDETLYMDEVVEGKEAIGTGQQIALARMDAGECAYKAVQYTCSKLSSCSPPIHRYRRKG